MKFSKKGIVFYSDWLNCRLKTNFKMKNLYSLLVVLSLLSLSLSFSSCKDDCETVTCLNGGTCNNGSCDCVSGFSGSDCSNIVCQNGGTNNADGSCNCPSGFTGANCETVVVTGGCSSPGNECQNGGECISGVCDCTIGFTGSLCQQTFAQFVSGNYSVSSTCVSGSYSSTITEDPDYPGAWNRIRISNPMNTGSSFFIPAQLSSSSAAINVPSVSVNGMTISGNGTYTASTVNLTLTYDLTSCTETYTR